MPEVYRKLTAKAPVNIAVIKYWGKSDEELKIPVNDSLSGTLDINDMCATTSVAISDTFASDELWLNGTKQDLTEKSMVKVMLSKIRSMSKLSREVCKCNVHIVSHNNFPTAAGLASSAAGYACLAYVLGQIYGITDLSELSRLARQGSGSACRSLFGGFVQWRKGFDNDSSLACQVVDHDYWPEIRVIICVVSDHEKDVSSSSGMLRSIKTSSLLEHRAANIVPARIDQIKKSILDRDFETFANITMQDSNQFHAICLDSYPPLFYLNDTSRQIIKICTILNAYFGKNVVAYTFDAGPNACIYLLDNFVDNFISLIQEFFPRNQDQAIPVKGAAHKILDNDDIISLKQTLTSGGVKKMHDTINYLISTSIGEGPKLVDIEIDDENLKP